MLSIGIDIGGTRVKAALLREGACVATHASPRYRNPAPRQLLAAVVECTAGLRGEVKSGEPLAAGLCAPGLLTEDRSRIAYSANLPALQELAMAEVLSAALQAISGASAGGTAVVTDQIAGATDYAATRTLRGRLLAVSIGTGVGAAVLDCDEEHPLGRPLRVSGDSPGHIGQMDVSLGADPPVAPDGGAGSLEAYIGAAALRGRDPSSLRIEDEPVRALVRALRICHAVYRPHEIAILGGVGIRLRHLAEGLGRRIGVKLSRIAREDWRLGFGEDDFHAARGAARLACARDR